ncbi:hypothetical protein WDU94_012295, partial [Cyamophila willieti]
EKIPEDKMKVLRTSLTKEIFKSSPEEAPRFTNHYTEKSVLYITCADEASRAWLVQKIDGPLKNCVDIPLKVGPSKDIIKTIKLIVHVPEELMEELGVDEPKRIIPLLATQNPGLTVDDLQVVHVQRDSGSTTIVVNVAEETLRKLREMEFKVHLGLSQLFFKVQGGKSNPSHAAGAPSKPSA